MLHFQEQGLLMKAMRSPRLIKNHQVKNKFLKVLKKQIKIKLCKKIWQLKKLKFPGFTSHVYKLKIK